MKFRFNKTINHKGLWLDSMTGMSMGFFSTLIVGSFFGIFGIYSKDNFFLEIKTIVSFVTPFGIGIAIALKNKRSHLQVFAIAISCLIAARSLIRVSLSRDGNFDFIPLGQDGIRDFNWSTNFTIINFSIKSSGDVFAAWIVGVAMLYFFEVFQWESNFDFLLVPILGIFLGCFCSLWLTYVVSLTTSVIEWCIFHSANNGQIGWAIALSPIIGLLMGLSLSLPTSSAAMAIALQLHGDAAVAAMAGTSIQMLSFGVLTWWSSRDITKTLAVSFGTSMLHMSNYMRRPLLLVIPSIGSAVGALIAVAAFHGKLPFPIDTQNNVGVPTTGMGTVALYGQIFTLEGNGWGNISAWMHVLFIQLALPVVITVPLLMLFAKKQWIKKEWLTLWEDIVPNTLEKPEPLLPSIAQD